MADRRRPLRRRLGQFALATVAAAAMAGCSFMPRYQRPAAPVPEQFPAYPGASTPNSQVAAADIGWEAFFGDPRLRRLVQIALQNNRDLRIAALNIEQARAVFQIRRADELPTLNGTSSITRQHTPATVSLLGRETTLTQYQVGLAVSSFELDFFGRIRSLSQQALAQYFSTEEARHAAQVSLVASVANVYLAMLTDDALIELTRQTLASRQETLRLSKLRFDAGVSSEVDLRQAETLVESSRASLAQVIRQRSLDENALVLLLGQSLPADLPTPLALTADGLLADVPVGLPSDLLVKRPDVRGAEQTLIAANANIGAARAAFFPRITLTGSGGLASTELSTLLRGNSLAWSLAPSASLPIFDGGRNQANLELAQVQRDVAIAQYERAIQTAFREVADALAGRATLSDQLSALQAQARAEEARLKLAELRYRGGVATFLDLLDAQRSLYLVQQSVLQVQATRLQNQVALYRALGGGWAPLPASPSAAGAPQPGSRPSLNGERSLSSSR